MKKEAWERFKRIALHSRRDPVPNESIHDVPIALIVDSPWLPGFMKISHLDYFTLPDLWLKSNHYIEERFPEVIFLPGFWVEYGMAIEPSAFGCKIVWWEDRPPSIQPVVHDISEISRLKVPNPSEDGLMPLALNLYRYVEKSVKASGGHIKMVAARGPLALAAHLMGVTDFLVALKLSPTEAKAFLEITTETVLRWLKAQAANLEGIEGIMVLDDIVGFLSQRDYLEFADPYLRVIFSSFPEMVKVYHNDSKIGHLLEPLAEAGFHVLNFSHELDIEETWQKVGHKICLMGNVPPLGILDQGTPGQVKEFAAACIRKTKGRGLVLSAGGGVSPGTTAENIDALVEASQCSGLRK